ncbi:MAG: response regulator [Candidatus Sulfotelmatobacter sp.]|jgi:two-component system, chemotaxis family, response regulator Rcp1
MPPQVLVVEDNPGDVWLMKEAFKDVNPLIRLQVAPDGHDAMAFLRREETYANATRPDLILLDLNLPKMGGRELLAQIKLDDDLKTIPTIVVTSSEADADVITSYRLHANSYVAKPMHFPAFHRLIKSINDFWLTGVKSMPSRTALYS